MQVSYQVVTETGTWIHAEGIPVTVYGVNYAIAAGETAVTLTNGDGVANTDFIELSRIGNANYTDMLSKNGIAFTNGCKVTGSCFPCTVFYTVYPQGTPATLVNLTESAQIDSGNPVMVYGLQAAANDAEDGSTVTLYNGTDNTGELVIKEDFVSTHTLNFTFPKPVAFPDGCYIECSVSAVYPAVYYTRI